MLEVLSSAAPAGLNVRSDVDTRELDELQELQELRRVFFVSLQHCTL